MTHIAALLLRIKVNNDKSQFVMIPKMLKELVPSDQLKAVSENEWKKVWQMMGGKYFLLMVLVFIYMWVCWLLDQHTTFMYDVYGI